MAAFAQIIGYNCAVHRSTKAPYIKMSNSSPTFVKRSLRCYTIKTQPGFSTTSSSSPLLLNLQLFVIPVLLFLLHLFLYHHLLLSGGDLKHKNDWFALSVVRLAAR